MKSRPLVSAIIIFLNTEKYLGEAIESVFAQSYRNWELLLCDDGSTDGSTMIARRYAEQFPGKVHYFEHEGHTNRGMSATRNHGLRQAEGEYIAWLDADDVWLPRKLEQQVLLMNEHPEAAMVYGPLQVWFSWTGKSDDYHRDFTQDIGLPPNTLVHPPQLLIHFLQNDMYIPSGVLVRRMVLKQVGGYEVSLRDEFSDVIVHSKICLKWPVFASGESWYKYRQHDASYCAQTRRGERFRRLKYLEKVAEHLSAECHENDEVWQVVEKQIRSHRPTICNILLESARQSATLLKESVRTGLRLGRKAAERTLPHSFRNLLALRWYNREGTPPSGWVHFGSLRRLTPISCVFGVDRGTPIDRYYIEQFLKAYDYDIQGRVLEIGDQVYTPKFGGERVIRSDTLQIRPGNPQSTLAGDLRTGEGMPENEFDCIVLSQGFPTLWDIRGAVATLRRALKPEGVMLATLPGISQISRFDPVRWADYWRFTSLSAKRLFEAYFYPGSLEIRTYGNVLAAVALLHGMAAEELRTEELHHCDPDYEIIITVRAVNSSGREGSDS